MPKITSPRQFRFVEAVAHGTATKPTSLTAEQAQQGLAELGHAGRSKFAKAKKGTIRLRRKR